MGFTGFSMSGLITDLFKAFRLHIKNGGNIIKVITEYVYILFYQNHLRMLF